MAVIETWGRLIWSSVDNAVGPAVTATGNSGAWALPAAGSGNFPASAIQMDKAGDYLLTASCTGVTGGGTPAMVVSLNGFDSQGNTIGPLMSVASLTSATAKFVCGGLHGASASTYFVAPMWGEVVWTITGTTPSFAGTVIELWGR